ncbi:LamG domain-containing protein, partial [Patescibacteria group bacterium]|nr:LamG domain-containing protein [Patescibacteria group bacterium]
MKKITRKKLIAIILSVLLLVAGYFAFLQKPETAAADWWDDSWLFRKEIPVTNNTTAESNVYIAATIDTSDTTKFQTDCGDLRWTEYGGALLPYYIASGCGTATTVVHINFASFPAGAQMIYYYYGNSSAANGSASADFSTTASNYTVGTIGAEEKGPGPVAFWKFDEGFGQTANDSTINANNGTLGSTVNVDANDPTWQSEDMCVSGKCLRFDGSDDYVDAGSGAPITNVSIWTLESWIKPASIPQSSIVVYNGNDSGGYGFGIANGGGDGGNGNKLVGLFGAVAWIDSGYTFPSANQWYHIAMVRDGVTTRFYVNGSQTDGTSVSTPSAVADKFSIGMQYNAANVLTRFFSGSIDSVKIYPYARTASQIKADYASRGTANGASVVIASEAKQSLSNGLVGYWKMDEASWNGTAGEVLDASGTGNNGVAAGATHKPTTGAGKFGNGGVFDGVDDYVNVTSIASLEPNNITVSAWVYFSNSSQSIISRGDPNYATMSYILYANSLGYNNRPIFYVKNASDVVVGAGNDIVSNGWHYITGTYDGVNVKLYIDGAEGDSQPQTGNIYYVYYADFKIGTAIYPNAFFNGSIDSVRIYNRALSPKEVRDLYNFAPGPVGWWKMDEKVSGNAKTLNDSSGYGNTGTTVDGANDTGMDCMVPGKIGGGCEFDGVDDYVNAGNGASLGFTSSFTVGGWMKIKDTNPNALVAKDWGVGSARGWYFATVQTTNQLRFLVSSDGTTISFLTTTNSFNLNEWYHLTGVYDALAQTLKVYVNGVKWDGTITGTVPVSIYNSSLNVTIGASGGYANGSIDDVRIYNYARTASQIAEDYAGGAGRKQPVGYWKFDEGYGITANNSGIGGSALNGTLTTMASPAT